MAKKNRNMTACSASPPIRILTPTLAVGPTHSTDDATLDPAACTKKVSTSLDTKTRVRSRAGTPKTRCPVDGGSTARMSRPMRR